MDMKYRIWLLFQVLPYGLIAGLVGSVAACFLTMKKKGSIKNNHYLTRKILLGFSSGFYIAVILGLFLFHSSRLKQISISLPFVQFAEALQNGSTYLMINVLLNVIVFIPFGCFVPLLENKISKTYWMFSISFLSSCCIELVQMVTLRGAFSCDDIIGNVIGAMLGFGTIRLITKINNKMGMSTREILKKEFTWYIILLVATSSVFILGFIYCKVNTRSDNSYYSYVEKIYITNKRELQEYADQGNYFNFPNIESVRDMSYSADWFQLELGRRFNGNDLIYYGLFYLSDTANIQNEVIVDGGIKNDIEKYSYETSDGTHYELKDIEDGFFYYMVKY